MPLSRSLLIIALLWAAIYLPGLGGQELKGEEGRRILPGVTMLKSGDWIVPRVAGEVYNRKPPLVNWAIAASIKLGERTEFWARLPSTLSALALALGIAVFCRGFLGEGGAFAAAIMALANISLVEKGRLAEIEPLYIALAGLAICAWAALWLRGANRWLTWIVAGLLLGAGFLAKGPLHVVIFYVFAALVLHKAKALREIASPPSIAGLLALAAVAAPWFWLNLSQNPDEGAKGEWLYQITHRLGMNEFSLSDWLLSVPLGILNFLPWSPLLILLWRRRVVESLGLTGRERAFFYGARLALAICFFAIALLPSSRPRFTLPLLAPACVLVAFVLARSWPFIGETIKAWWARVFAALCALIAAGAPVAAFVTKQTGPPGLAAAGVCLVGGIFAARWILGRDDRSLPRLALAGALPFCLAAAVLGGIAYPAARAHEDIRPTGKAMRAAAGDGVPAVVYKAAGSYQPWLFYLGEPYAEAASWGDLPDLAEAGAPALITPERRWEREGEKLTKRYGPPKSVQPVDDPRERERYVIVRF